MQNTINMNIGVIGIGKIGLGIALNLEDKGYNVIGYDISPEYVKNINNKIIDTQEPQYNHFLKKSTNFQATNNIKDVLSSDLIFIMVRTESKKSGEYDCSQIEDAYSELIEYKQEIPKSLVLCSNVNPGYSDKLASRLIEYGYKLSFNPEIVAQGSIMDNLSNPSSIIIGEYDKSEGTKLENIYKSFTNAPIYRMDRTSAELFKIGFNCFLTTKIAYANSLGDLAIKMGRDPEVILKAIGSHNYHKGNKFFSYGHSYGGPCFPRDNRALIYTSEQWGEKALIQKAVDESNNDHLQFMINHFVENNNLKDPIITKEVTFKPGVPYIEESKQLEYMVGLAKKGFYITIKQSSQVINKIKKIHGNLFKYLINE